MGRIQRSLSRRGAAADGGVEPGGAGGLGPDGPPGGGVAGVPGLASPGFCAAWAAEPDVPLALEEDGAEAEAGLADEGVVAEPLVDAVDVAGPTTEVLVTDGLAVEELVTDGLAVKVPGVEVPGVEVPGVEVVDTDGLAGEAPDGDGLAGAALPVAAVPDADAVATGVSVSTGVAVTSGTGVALPCNARGGGTTLPIRPLVRRASWPPLAGVEPGLPFGVSLISLLPLALWPSRPCAAPDPEGPATPSVRAPG
jgi:hypothetical protein